MALRTHKTIFIKQNPLEEIFIFIIYQNYTLALKPMDSFGTCRYRFHKVAALRALMHAARGHFVKTVTMYMAKIIIIIFFFWVNAEFYRVVWTINALLTVRSEMLPFSGNIQNTKMFGVPPNTLP